MNKWKHIHVFYSSVHYIRQLDIDKVCFFNYSEKDQKLINKKIKSCTTPLLFPVMFEIVLENTVLTLTNCFTFVENFERGSETKINKTKILHYIKTKYQRTHISLPPLTENYNKLHYMKQYCTVCNLCSLLQWECGRWGSSACAIFNSPC